MITAEIIYILEAYQFKIGKSKNFFETKKACDCGDIRLLSCAHLYDLS